MNPNTLKSVFVSLFAALICAGCFISIPLPGLVPITLQNMFAIMAGTILGGVQGAGAVGLFLILGCIGVPVFSGMHGGIGVLTGPTGGFLIGYFLAALAAGLILGNPTLSEDRKNPKFIIKVILAVIIAFVLNYLPGIPWFISVMTNRGKDMALSGALKACLIPFIPGDVIKMIVTIILTLTLRPVIARYFTGDQISQETQEA